MTISRPLSFRMRLTVRWTVAFGLLMMAALSAVYLGARAYGYHAIDLHLRTVAATELASSTDQGAPIHLHEFPESALNASEFAPKFSQVYDSTGRMVLQTGSAGRHAPLLDRKTLDAAFAGEAPLVDVQHDAGPGRMVALRSTDSAGQSYVIAVGMLTRTIDVALARLVWMLAGIWLAAVGATAGIGYVLASRALAPIDRITARAADIARDPRDIRLDAPDVDDEIGRMTVRLNAMLDRLHTLIDASRHFAADASHELRSPLTAIAGEIDVALIRDRRPDEYRETLRLVRAQVNEMFTLADNLTLLGRAERGQSEEMVREVPLALVLIGCRERLRHIAQERQVELRVIEPRAELVVFGDMRLIGRAIENVIANALQHSPAGGFVVVGTTYTPPEGDVWDPARVQLHVSDSGPGIPAAEWERIFDRFYRLDASRSRRTGGTGLGLAITRAILRLFDGHVRVVSSSAAGSTFELEMRGGLCNIAGTVAAYSAVTANSAAR